MLMPEAAVHKDHCAMAGKDEVGTTREISSVETKAQAERMQIPAHDELGLGVAAADQRHHAAPGLGIKDVGHARPR